MASFFKREFNQIARHPRAALLFVLLSGLLASGGFPTTAYAQVNATIGNVNLNANLATSLTVSAAPGSVNFALPPNGVANGSATINITTTWALSPSSGRVTLWGYFSSAAAALSDGAGDNIPSSSISGSPNAGAFTPFTGAGPFAAGSSLQIVSFRVLGFNKSGTRSDTLDMRISTAGLNLPAGNYAGTLKIQAQAI